MLRGVPIYHGLKLALKVLGSEMPNAALAKQVVQNYESDLSVLATTIETNMSKRRTKNWPEKYDVQALEVWRSCIGE